MNMNSRWHGVALFIGGILMGIGLLIHPNEAADPSAVITGRWSLAHGLLFVGAIPALLGLVSVYERLKGLLGFTAYLLTFGGIASFIFAFALETFVVPVMAADPNAGMLLDPAGPLLGGPLGAFLLVISLAFTLGAVLLGIAILRSSDLPRWSGILWIVAAPVSLVPPLPFLVLLISGAALGLAFAVTGFAIWSRQMPMSRPAAA
jgi:uncharacterized YccA/Bax inhibitor family protein